MSAKVQSFYYKSFQIYKFDELDSTNNYLKKKASCFAPTLEYTPVIWAKNQTQGRGQKDNIWLSESGKNLTFSFLLRDKYFAKKTPFEINQWMAASLHQYLSRFSKDFAIKWPNDLYFKEKKIGGILIENSWLGSQYQHTVVGIGLNINQTTFDEKLSSAVSLTQITEQAHELETVLTDILQEIEKNHIAHSPDKSLADYYLEHLLWRNQTKTFVFEKTRKTFNALIKGVDENGNIIVQTQLGEEKFSHSEAKLLL